MPRAFAASHLRRRVAPAPSRGSLARARVPAALRASRSRASRGGPSPAPRPFSRAPFAFARGGRADEPPRDANGLSDAERAAMRAEWSLECRQVGLDHLADCFKRPAASNPADPDAPLDDLNPKKTVPPARKNKKSILAPLGPCPVKLATARVAPTDDEPALLAFLRGVGADAVAHTGAGAFDAHLLGVRRVMQAWAPDNAALADAALFHSVYGTEGFQGFALPMDRRGDVRALIGERAEFLVWVFCVVDRLSVDNDLDAAAGAHAFRARPELGGETIPMPDDLWFDFVVLTLGDWLEQVEGAAGTANAAFEWGVGDAWGYRRGAYERMAELVGEKIPAAAELRSRVYAREPMETRGVRQPITPPMSDAIREGRERDAGDAEEPKYP